MKSTHSTASIGRANLPVCHRNFTNQSFGKNGGAAAPPYPKRRVWILRILWATILCGLFSRAEAQDHKTIRVACVGDSIVYGAGVDHREENCWPAVLGRWLGADWNVRNFGLNGATMLHQGDLPYARQKICAEALNFKPDVLIISLGANDSKHPTNQAKNAVNNWQHKEDFASDYKEMITAFKTANPAVKIYVCIPAPAFPGQWGINDTTIREEVTPLVRQVAHDTGAQVIDLYTALSGKRELFPDTVHPNAAGARLIAAAVFPALTGKQAPTETP